MTGMSMHWRDIDKRLEPGVWDGLLLSLDERRTPGFAVSICPPHRLRVSVHDMPVMWTRVDRDYYGYELLRVAVQKSWEIVPPIPFWIADEIAKSDRGSAMRRWARFFAQSLSTSPHSPLDRGDWYLSPSMRWHEEGMLCRRNIEGVLAHGTCEYIDWDREVHPLPLRNMSPSTSGRVKAWCKLARRDELPPILLYWISGLAAYVVLDGHDRLLAAHIESKPAPFLALDRVMPIQRKTAEDRQRIFDSVEKAFDHSANKSIGFRDSRKFTPEKSNRLLLDAFMPALESQLTMATPVPIIDSDWISEVRNEAALQGVDIEELIGERHGA